ncbi:uncharacterized protein LOC111245275 [Varroa destructor]|uniref:Uncharacterized protein n=1 Tax=Varroa destructor TaxID=109461 RepID=A0A7M7M4U8_VARDE|nr:uncharacterized protein LOC111245275 [Varroa destructor]
MQLLVQWLRGPGASPTEVKSTLLAHLQQPGIGVARSYFEEICQCTKRFLGSRGERAEGLALLDLVLEQIPDGVLSQDIVHFMKQLITLSANEGLQQSCFTLLHRLILRLRSLKYIQRDMNTEVFPPLVQMLTRRLAVVPASPNLLALTRATFAHFSKMCLPNRDQFERFLFKQIVAAERHDTKSGQGVVNTLAALSQCYVDPAMRHDIQSKHLEMLIRSCLLTEQAFLAGLGHCDPSQLQNTIYAVADEQLFPVAVGSGVAAHVDMRMILWKRLILQLDAVEAILGSPSAKDIRQKLLLTLINQMVICASTDEHLLFLRPTLIHRAVRIARQLISNVRTHKIILVNARLADFFLHVLEVAHQTDPVDMSMLRAEIYEAIAVWIRNLTPSSLTYRGEALLRLVNMTSKDVASACDPDAVITRGAEERCAAALALQRAIVLGYGEQDSDIVRQLLLKLIPATVRLTRPLAGALLTCSRCRRQVYDLLAAFVISPNPSLMPPTAEIMDVVRDGLYDDVYEVREACDIYYRILCNTLQPLECGFALSYSHAMHEHNRRIRRLELTRSERTRSAEIQTDDATLYPPTMVDKTVLASLMPMVSLDNDEDDDDEEAEEEDDMSDVDRLTSPRGSGPITTHHRRQPFPYQARNAQHHRPGPRSVKERRAVDALCELEEARASDAIQLEESLSEDEDMMDDEDLDDEQMELDAQAVSAYRASRAGQEEPASAADPVIIPDDDEDVAITSETRPGAAPSRGTGTASVNATAVANTQSGVIAGEIDDDGDEDIDDADVDDMDDGENEGEDDEDIGDSEVVCVIEDEDEQASAHHAGLQQQILRQQQLQQRLQQQPQHQQSRDGAAVDLTLAPLQPHRNEIMADDSTSRGAVAGAAAVVAVVVEKSAPQESAATSVEPAVVSITPVSLNGACTVEDSQPGDSNRTKSEDQVNASSTPVGSGTGGKDQGGARLRDEGGASGKVNGAGDKLSSPKVNGESTTSVSGGDLISTVNQGEIAKKSSPTDKVDEIADDEIPKANIIPIGPDDSDEEGGEVDLAAPSSQLQERSDTEKESSSGTGGKGLTDCETRDQAASTKSEDSAASATVIIAD